MQTIYQNAFSWKKIFVFWLVAFWMINFEIGLKKFKTKDSQESWFQRTVIPEKIYSIGTYMVINIKMKNMSSNVIPLWVFFIILGIYVKCTKMSDYIPQNTMGVMTYTTPDLTCIKQAPTNNIFISTNSNQNDIYKTSSGKINYMISALFVHFFLATAGMINIDQI